MFFVSAADRHQLLFVCLSAGVFGFSQQQNSI
jgi:hypothetical protein